MGAETSEGMSTFTILIMFGMVFAIPIIIGILAFFSIKPIIKRIKKEKFERKHKIISLIISIVATFAVGIPLLTYWFS